MTPTMSRQLIIEHTIELNPQVFMSNSLSDICSKVYINSGAFMNEQDSLGNCDDNRSDKPSNMGPRDFEEFARRVMSEYFGVELRPGKKPDWPKTFDMVSPDYRIVGDAKYYTMVRGKRLPSAKFANISKEVWFLEHIDADVKFLAFGNDIRVPEEWLKRYGYLLKTVKFYFIHADGKVEELKPETPRGRHSRPSRRLTCREAVKRAILELGGGPVTAEELFSKVRELGDWSDDTIWQHLMWLVVNLPPAYRHWPRPVERFLFLREDGKYELYDPEKHGIYHRGTRVG